MKWAMQGGPQCQKDVSNFKTKFRKSFEQQFQYLTGGSGFNPHPKKQQQNTNFLALIDLSCFKVK